jgi:hypothetical protein
VEIKCQLDATDEFLLQILLFAARPQTGHTTLSSTPNRQLENQAPKTTGGNHLYNTRAPDDGHNGARNMLSKQ